MMKKPLFLESALETTQLPANAGTMATFYPTHLVFILYVLCHVESLPISRWLAVDWRV